MHASLESRAEPSDISAGSALDGFAKTASSPSGLHRPAARASGRARNLYRTIAVQDLAAVPSPPIVDAAGKLESMLAAMKVGDEAALRALRRACSKHVRACAMKFARSEERADEAVSACFAQAWRDARLYEASRGSVLAWLLTIVRSRAIDGLRSEAARARHEVSLDDERIGQIAAENECGPLARLERARRDAALGAMLARLPGTQRQALWLSFGLGLSHEEIASRAGLPLGTVKSHIQRGMRTLRVRCEAAGLSA